MPSYCEGEGCAEKKKQAFFGIKGSGKPQWCAICAKRHGGVLLGKWQMCEDCHDKWAHCLAGAVAGARSNAMRVCSILHTRHPVCSAQLLPVLRLLTTLSWHCPEACLP